MDSAFACCLSVDAAERRQGEEELGRLAAAGPAQFCTCLLGYLEASATSAESASPPLDSARLLAATQLKNHIVRRWRGRAMTAEQKEALRGALLRQLARPEPSEAVGSALATTVAVVMRSESNRADGTVLRSLSYALDLLPAPGGAAVPAAGGGGGGGRLEAHALLALLHTAKELASMRLPAQRELGRQWAVALLPRLLPRWAASLDALSAELSAAAQPAAQSRAAGDALLLTKLTRRLLQLVASGGGEGGEPPPAGCCSGGSAGGGSAGEWSGAARGEWWPAVVVRSLEAADALRTACGAASAAAPPPRLADRFGAALGKLVRQASQAGERAGERAGAAGAVGGAAGGGTALQAAAQGCTRTLLGEASERAAASSSGDGAARRWRERRCSAFCAQAAELLAELWSLPPSHPALASWLSGGGGGEEQASRLVGALLQLLERPLDEVEEWGADPEGAACACLMPPLEASAPAEPEEGGKGGAHLGEAAAAAEEEEEADADDDEAEAWAGGGGGESGRAERLREGAERALSCLVALLPLQAGRALLRAMPASAAGACEQLPTALARDARYCALGLCASELQSHLSFRQVLSAAAAEAPPLCRGEGGYPPPLRAVLQARLCWLLPSWWAFGSSGDEADDAAATLEAFTLLAALLDAAADVSAALHAAHALCSLLRHSALSDLAAMSPLVPRLSAGLAARLPLCRGDEAQLWLLAALRELLQSAPAAQPHASVWPALSALWERAAHQRRDLVVAELTRLHRGLSAAPRGVS